MSKYLGIKEEELKNRISIDLFSVFDTSRILGNVDYSVTISNPNPQLIESPFLLWAEAKTGTGNLYNALVQLIITVGKERTFDKYLPPIFLSAFDYGKIIFIPFEEVYDIFHQNDFNWNIRPSDHKTREFKQIYARVSSIINKNALVYDYQNDSKELKKFITKNFVEGKHGITKVEIHKNNFMSIYNKWLLEVKPSIAVVSWEKMRETGLIDGDFYLADLISEKNKTIQQSLHVLLEKNKYRINNKKIEDTGLFGVQEAFFNDEQKAHNQFWNRYERPPNNEYWEHINDRRDLLVPQDIRERKGSYFTPAIWVDKAHEHLAEVLGENWQEEYYIWDCSAGTGNLLNNMTYKHRIFASTLDQQDVDVMYQRIENGANLLRANVFKFDFLNDSFDNLPSSLKSIIDSSAERKKLIILINPPYAEAGSVMVSSGRRNKKNVSNQSLVWQKNKDQVGMAIRELFIQFFLRINLELTGSYIASFSKLKFINGKAFDTFREIFNARFIKGFMAPANTFDNVKGKFPIGFTIWKTGENIIQEKLSLDIYNKNGTFIDTKNYYLNTKEVPRITEWIRGFIEKDNSNAIGYTGNDGPDFQHNNYCFITRNCKVNSNGSINNSTKYPITIYNIIPISVYFSVRHCIEATWINDRDQFLSPNTGWMSDIEFHNDCLTFCIFHTQNRISKADGINHWIPFSEQAVDAKGLYKDRLLLDYINGKLDRQPKKELFPIKRAYLKPLEFSLESENVFTTALDLWVYYHSKNDSNPNAAYYDIREYFQGRNDKSGKMNNSSDDPKYTALHSRLKTAMKTLSLKIEPKIKKYGFLR